MRASSRAAAGGAALAAPMAAPMAVALVAVALLAGGCGTAPGRSGERGAGVSNAGTQKRSGAVRVIPASGEPSTTFTVAYRTRLRIGRAAGRERGEVISARASRHGAGCEAAVQAPAPPTPAGRTVRVRLAPKGPDRRWCTGSWHGEIVGFERPVCPAHRLCPQLILDLGRQGSFGFRVHAVRR
jgi:hypothetical protein